jgi:hypothetical protein
VEIFTTSPAIPTSIGHLLLGDFQEDNITTGEVAGYAANKTDPPPQVFNKRTVSILKLSG